MYASQPNLDTKKPVGNGINAPEYFNGVADIAKTMSASTTNPDSNINQVASTENRSAKFKNPNVKQSANPAAEGQYQ